MTRPSISMITLLGGMKWDLLPLITRRLMVLLCRQTLGVIKVILRIAWGKLHAILLPVVFWEDTDEG